MVEINTKCLVEDLGVGIGCMYDMAHLSQLNVNAPGRYTITYDLSRVGCIAENCYSILWPHLQFQYHRNGGLKALNWVEGTFNA